MIHALAFASTINPQQRGFTNFLKRQLEDGTEHTAYHPTYELYAESGWVVPIFRARKQEQELLQSDPNLAYCYTPASLLFGCGFKRDIPANLSERRDCRKCLLSSAETSRSLGLANHQLLCHHDYDRIRPFCTQPDILVASRRTSPRYMTALKLGSLTTLSPSRSYKSLSIHRIKTRIP